MPEQRRRAGGILEAVRRWVAGRQERRRDANLDTADRRAARAASEGERHGAIAGDWGRD
jgi:hypothetical protein